MTYADVAAWVEEHFNVSKYFNPDELIRDVKDRFEYDGSVFPKQAEDNIRTLWRETITGVTTESLDAYDVEPQRETLDDIRNDYRQRFSNFFEYANPEPEYHDVEETLATPPPVVDQMPDVTPSGREEQRSWFTGGFKSLGQRIWKLFGR